MIKFLKAITSLGVGVLGFLITGGVVQLISRFAQYPISFRAACGVGLLLSFHNLRNINWKAEDKEFSELMEDAIKGTLATGLFALFVLFCGWVFTIFS